MNDVKLETLKAAKTELLMRYGLDEDTVTEFRSKIQKVDLETSENLGKQLFQYISSMKPEDINYDAINKITGLIIDGADLEYKGSRKGNFALLNCTRKGLLQVAYLLMRAGANVNQVNDYGTTTLMAAARHGHNELVELLILFGADVNAVCLDGDNAIMSAKRHSQDKCFKILADAQASLTHRNNNNETLFDLPGTISPEILNFKLLTFQPAAVTTTENDIKALIKETEQILTRSKKS